ncbi:hypothetical protein D8674_017089 [Pyrus ussuriensis x Pyrus communis]|uniref:Uncharacterized protein n=1 Tax=Pyrus ussuriensis x Pyrus communis TaxID=2448454 RepID=A0A5N5HBP9_9ROSA|nr:hypothetical protein D8674_017089 [Pyrus ussuriensis x Pyrus communis]
MEHPGVFKCINKVWIGWYKEWKYDLHVYYQTCASLTEALTDPPRVCREDGRVRVVVRSFLELQISSNYANREVKPYLHHSDSQPLTYRVKEHHEKGAFFLEVETWRDTHANYGNHFSTLQKKDEVPRHPLEAPIGHTNVEANT